MASDPRIDALRAKMVVYEEKRYSRGYMDPRTRSNAHAIRVHFKDGTATKRVEVEFPLGHRRRRAEGIPVVREKFESSVARAFAAKQALAIRDVCFDRERLVKMPVNEFFDLMIK